VQVGWLGLSVSSHTTQFYIHQMNEVNSYTDFVCRDSTTNIGISITLLWMYVYEKIMANLVISLFRTKNNH